MKRKYTDSDRRQIITRLGLVIFANSVLESRACALRVSRETRGARISGLSV